MHVRGDRHGQSSGELLGLEEPRVLRREPGLGERQHRPRVPEHAGVGLGVLAQVRHGLAVAQLHRVQGAPARRRRRRLARRRHRHRRRHRRHRRRTATPDPRAQRRPDPEQGPLQVRRQRALHGQRRAPRSDPDHPTTRARREITHAADQPTCVWQSRGMPTLSEDLAFRGLIHQMTDPDLPKRLDQPGLTVYAGFDPSADSLHVGNLLQLCTLRRFQEAGHRPISLAGGGTGMIGDPGGKQDERQLLDLETIEGYLEGIRPQLGQFLDLDDDRALLLNNADWLGTLSTLEYLRDVGKHFTVNQMVAKESVKTRFERPDQGISLHRVQLHAAPGLRLPAPARRPRLRPAVRRQRPVGQHHHGRRAHPQGLRRRGLGLHHAAHRQARRHQVRQDRVGHGLARCRSGPAPSPCTSSSSTRPTSRSASCSGSSPSSTTTRSAALDAETAEHPQRRAAQKGPGPRRGRRSSTARPRWPSARRPRRRSSARRSPASARRCCWP